MFLLWGCYGRGAVKQRISYDFEAPQRCHVGWGDDEEIGVDLLKERRMEPPFFLGGSGVGAGDVYCSPRATHAEQQFIIAELLPLHFKNRLSRREVNRCWMR